MDMSTHEPAANDPVVAVHLWNRALTDDEIEQAYQAGPLPVDCDCVICTERREATRE